MSSSATEYAAYRAQYEALAASGENHWPAWLTQRRAAAWERFGALGFPTPRDEDWQHTNLAPLRKVTFQPARAETAAAVDAAALRELTIGEHDWPRLVFVDGIYRADLSTPERLPPGVTAANLAGVLSADGRLLEPHLAQIAGFDRHPFAALNSALFTDGLYIHVPRGQVVEQPIVLQCVSTAGETPTAAHSRLLLIAEESSQVKLIEHYAALGNGAYFNNVVTEIVCGPNAQVEHVKIQQESEAAFHFSYFQAKIARDSRLASHAIHLGGRLVRSDVRAWLGGAGIHATFNGLHMLRGRQHVDTNMWIDHAAPHCESHELYKSVIDDRAVSAFRGRIHVHAIAQKTDAYQTNNNLLLSPKAAAKADPQLEIYADDVKCSHGATIGQLDEQALFYLRSRGLAKPAAVSLLVFAFLGEVVDKIGVEAVREDLRKILRSRLPDAQQLE